MNRQREFEFEFNSIQFTNEWMLRIVQVLYPRCALCMIRFFAASSQESSLSSSSINYKHLKNCHSNGCKQKVNASPFKPFEYHISIDEFNKCCFFCACNRKYLLAISTGNLWFSFLLPLLTFDLLSQAHFHLLRGDIFFCIEKEIFLNLKVVGLLAFCVIKIQCLRLTIQLTYQPYITSINMCK